MAKKTYQTGSSSNSSNLSANYLADITFGMEIERYNFCPDSRSSFARDYAKQLEIEQMEKVRFQLALPTDKDKMRAGNLCTVYKIEKYEYKELLKQAKGQLTPAKISTMQLTNEERERRKEEAMAARREGKVKEKSEAPNDIEIRNRIIEDFKKSPKKEIFQVRLDGEQDFRLLHLGLAEEKKDDYAWNNLFNIEFISSGVGSGIKRFKDFFAHFDSPGAKDNNEVRQTLDNFSRAAANLKKENGSHQNICLLVNSKNGDAYLYEFPEWVIGYFKPSDPSKQVIQERQSGGKEAMMHVTHSLPIVRDEDYLSQLGNAFIGEGRAQQSAKKSSIEMAFPTTEGTEISTSDDITRSRNDNQPLFKSPREHFVPGNNQYINKYLEEARQKKVLQPTSNRLDFIDADLVIYKSLLEQLKEELEEELDSEALQEELQPPEELEVLENTIAGLNGIIKPYETIGKGSRDTIRVFESHDEKFQLIYSDKFAGEHNVYYGLLEGRERSSLVKYIAGVALGQAQGSFPEKYLSSLNTAIYIATQQTRKALKKVTELQVESINEDDFQYAEEDQGTSNKDLLNDSTTQISNKKEEDSNSEGKGGKVVAQTTQKESDSNSQGEGTLDHDGSSYWYVYTKTAMESMLELRLKSAEIKAEDARIINPHYIFNEAGVLALIQDLVFQINAIYMGTGGGITPTLLIPVNINNQHWVGITVEFIDDKIKVTYMDSEANPMPKSLNEGLKAELGRSYSDLTIEIAGKEVELQKYNNCGLEVIENLIAAVAGKGARIDQEEELEFHSELYEQYLIEKALQVEKVTQEIGSKDTYEAGQDSTIKELSNTHQVSWEEEMDKIWEEAQSSNLGEEELRVMDAIWTQAQACSVQTTERGVGQHTSYLKGWMKSVKDSMVQSGSILTQIQPNDIISAMNSMAKLLAGVSSNCGVEVNAPTERVPERLDVFNSTQNNISGIPSRNGSMSSSEMLSVLDPLNTTGSIGESLVE